MGFNSGFKGLRISASEATVVGAEHTLARKIRLVCPQNITHCVQPKEDTHFQVTLQNCLSSRQRINDTCVLFCVKLFCAL